MVHLNTVVQVVDNSGVVVVKCIGLLRGSKKNSATVGNYFVASVKKTLKVKRSRVSTKKLMKPGNICKCLVVCVNNNISRKGSFYFKSDKNSSIIVSDNFMPSYSRIVGPVFQELRAAKQVRVLSIADYVF